jgi:hypothetical protein
VFVGRDSSVGIATGYGLDGSGIESRWGPDFSHTSRIALGPTQPPVQWVPGLSRGWNGRGVVLTTQPLLVLRSGKSRAIPPSGPSGLLRGTFTFTVLQMCLSEGNEYSTENRNQKIDGTSVSNWSTSRTHLTGSSDWTSWFHSCSYKLMVETICLFTK